MSEAFESNYHIAQGENVQGPYTLSQTQLLIEEGKVRADMLFSRDGADWVEGYQLPELFPDAPAAPAAPVRGGGLNPGLHRDGSRGRSRGRVEAHRGGAILALGIIGLVLCQICGIIAWVMANTDLAKMKAGRMDRTGESMTQAGKILGIISAVLLVLTLIWIVFIMGIAVTGVSSSGM
jgi:hypothetical protein